MVICRALRFSSALAMASRSFRAPACGFLLADVQLSQAFLSRFHSSLKGGEIRVGLMQFIRCLTVTPVRLLHRLFRDGLTR